MEGERKFLHSTLGEWGHPRDVPSSRAHIREKREPEDKAAAMVGRAEEEEEGVGGVSIPGIHVPALPCFSLTQSFPGESQGHIHHCLHLSQLLTLPRGTSARPGTWDARCDAGGS